MNRCPPHNCLEDLLEERLGDTERGAVEAHVETCRLCQGTLERLLKDGNGETPLPGRGTKAPANPEPDEAFLLRLKQGPRPGTGLNQGPAGAMARTVPLPGVRAAPPEGQSPAVAGYEILGELGHGGMGVIYKARQSGLDRLVALKMIRAGVSAGPQALARFRREAEVVARFQHPNILQIYEIGEQNGLPYFALEYMGGGSLAERIQGTPQPAQPSATLAAVLATAIHYAHRHGIIHRDLKPSNVLLTADGTPKIADFGLAKRLDAELGQTLSGTILGTPSYMAPEQAGSQSADVGPGADVYALGAILYEMLTGRPPFKAAAPLDTLQQVISEEPVPPSRLQPRVPRDLETICLKCLEKERHRRYATAEALAEDLQHFLGGTPIRARRIGPLGRAGRWCRRNPVLATLTAGIALSLLAVALVASILSFQLREERNDALRLLERARRAEQQAKAAQKEALDKLWDSSLARARAARWSGQAGRRAEALRALAEAAAIRPTLELRNEAIACLALTDLHVAREWPPLPRGSRALAFDARLERYACRSGSDALVIRRAADHRELHRLPGGADPGLSLFSPDGRFLAAGCAARGPLDPVEGGTARFRVWELKGSRLVVDLAGAARPTTLDFNFTPDSRRVAAGCADGSIVLYALPSGKRECRLERTGSVRCLAFHPRGPQLAVGRMGTEGVQVREITTGQVIHHFPLPSSCRSVAWRGDGRLLAAACDDCRIYVWDMRDRQLLVHLEGHQAQVVRLAFSHGGDLLMSQSWDQSCRLWDPVTGRQLASVPQLFLRFSPDDRWLAFRHGRSVGAWELAFGREFRTLRHTVAGSEGERAKGKGGPGALAFSPNGRLLVSISSDSLRVWDTVSGGLAARMPARFGHAAVFDGRGDLLVPSALGVHRWPVHRRDADGWVGLGPPEPLDLFEEEIAGSAYCDRAGDRFAFVAGDGKQGVVLNIKRPTERVVLQGQGPLGCIALSADGRWAAAGSSDHVSGTRVWNARTGQTVKDLPGGNARVAFSPDGRWLVTGMADAFSFWRVGTWQAGRTIPRGESRGLVGPLAFAPDGRVLALAITPCRVRLIEVATGRELATLSPPDPQLINGLSFSPSGNLLAVATGNHAIQLWDLHRIRRRLAALGLARGLPAWPPTPRPQVLSPPAGRIRLDARAVRCLSGHTGEVRKVHFTPDGRRALSASEDGTLRLWDLGTGKELRRFTGHEKGVEDLALSPDGRQALSAAWDQTVRLWDVETGKELRCFRSEYVVLRVAFSPGGRRFLTGCGNNRVGVWDVASWREVRALVGHTESVWSVCFSPDGQHALSGSGDKTLRLWEAATGMPGRRFRGHTNTVQTLVFSSDGRHAFSGAEDNTIRFWDLATGKELACLRGHRGDVLGLALSPDGHTLLSGSIDGTVRLWDIKTRRVSRKFIGNLGAIIGVAFSPDGRRILTCGTDEKVWLWDLTVAHRSN